ncbi:MAG: hypothetical protein AAFR31_14610 [Cyanobacteria bacterium J06627_8]
MLFLAPLIAALGAAFLYGKCEQSSAEMAMICVAVALAGTVITIVIAPWPIQLALAIILITLRIVRKRTLRNSW